MKKIRVFEAFKGYGSQSLSLTDVGVPHDVVASSEIDIDAIIAYAAMRWDKEELEKQPTDISDEDIAQWLMDRNIGYDFKTNKSKIPSLLKKKDKTKLHTLYNSCVLSNEVGDISLVNPYDIPDHDLFTYSFPCQDISVAGKQAGLKKGEGTRSGLLWECEKIIAVKKPKYLLLENVKNLVGTKHKEDFDIWREWLESQGYTNTWKVVNGKDYDIPQNRERVFMISILGDEKFEFPQAPCTPVRLKDILESEVDKKYYINKPFTFVDKRDSDSVCDRIANVDLNGHDYIKRVYDTEKCSPTLPTGTGGSHEPKILEAQMKQNYVQYDLTGKQHNSQDQRAYYEDGFHGTIPSNGGESKCKVLENNTYRVRKLTPKECFRLMGISDERFERIKALGISDSQCYKLAGNRIIKNCLDNFFRELFKEYIVMDSENFTRPQEI